MLLIFFKWQLIYGVKVKTLVTVNEGIMAGRGPDKGFLGSSDNPYLDMGDV